MTDPSCPHCKGAGHCEVYVDDRGILNLGIEYPRFYDAKKIPAEVLRYYEAHWEPCLCTRRFPEPAAAHKHFKSRGFGLGSGIDIFEEDLSTDMESPLFTVGGVDLTKKNLFIKGAWNTIRRHLGWALLSQGPSFNFEVVTDAFILDVRLGKYCYTSRPKSERETIRTFNTLEDILGPGFPLVILFLGKLGYPNRAMGGYVLEALMARSDKPTWVIDDSKSAWGPGHHAWGDQGEALSDYFSQNNFETIELGLEGSGIEDEGDLSLGPAAEPKMLPFKPIKEAFKHVPDADFEEVAKESASNSSGIMGDMDSVLGGGSKYKKKSSKPRGGGNGPMGFDS